MIGIYKIVSPSGKIYIGSSKDIDKRFKQHRKMCKKQPKLYNSLLKYGIDKHTFSVVEICDLSILLDRELYYGMLYNVLDDGLNCKLPSSGDKYKTVCQETRDLLSRLNKGKIFGDPDKKQRPLSKEDVENIRKLLLENKYLQKDIAKMFGVSRKVVSNIKCKKSYIIYDTDLDMSKSKKMYEKLTTEDVINIRKLLNEKQLTQTEIAKLYNINASHISRINSGESHKKLTEDK